MKGSTVLAIVFGLVALSAVYFPNVYRRAAPEDSRHVVIIGGGAAGLSAAVEAYKAGARVTIVDKEGRLGGNSAKASSGINAANTKYQQEQGIDDSVALFMKDTLLSGGGISDPKLAKTLAAESSEAMDFLGDLGVNMSLIIQCGGHSTKRTHRHVTRPDKRPQNAGMEVIGALLAFLQSPVVAEKVSIRNGTKVLSLLRNEKEEVVGVELEDVSLRVRSRLNASAVIISTGGFGASAEMLKKYSPQYSHLPTTNGPFAQGEGILLGEGVGATVTQINHVQVHPTGFVDPKDETNLVKWLAPEALRGSGGILIGPEGKRFVNELAYRDLVTNAIFEHGWNGTRYISRSRGEIGGVKLQSKAVLVLNDAAARIFPLPPIYKVKGFVREAEGVEDLAGKIGVDPKALAKSLEDYNSAAAGETTDEFKKMTFPVKHFSAKEKLYYMIVTPSVHYTMGGLSIDSDARVLREKEVPVPNLFAAGEVTGGLHGKNRLAGNGMLDNIVFGRIAGREAAKIKMSRN